MREMHKCIQNEKSLKYGRKKLKWRFNHMFFVITNRDFYCMLHQNTVNNTSSTKTRIKSNAKSKCGKCQKHMREHLKIINCDTCGKYFHVKCSGTSKKVFLNLKGLNESWLCLNCLSNELPFYDLLNNDLYLEIKNTPIQKSDSVNSMPSFTS